ncbi:hypothetical protein SDJN03_23735, partial [Cucurbita argyrosperma subsp. sororia]
MSRGEEARLEKGGAGRRSSSTGKERGEEAARLERRGAVELQPETMCSSVPPSINSHFFKILGAKSIQQKMARIGLLLANFIETE